MHNKRINRIETTIYIITWILIVFGCTLHVSYECEESNTAFFTWHGFSLAMSDIMPLLVLFSINNYILIPRLIARNNLRAYISCLILVLVATGFIQFHIFTDFVPKYCPHIPDGPAMGPPRPIKHALLPPPFVHTLFYDILVVGINIAIWAVARQVNFRLENSRLKEANTRSQLDQLKAQINPHFYMNMLNSIHGLVDINPEKAKELIMDMSRLMAYMLYDSEQNTISLSKEIKFLKDYIRIIHERYPKGKVEISTFFPNDKEIENIMVPPLLFIAFIENAFKHGVDYRYHSGIIVSMDIFDNQLHFGCVNKLHPKNGDTIRKGGFGLENIKKRLLLLYGRKSTLKISKSQTEFIINLIIPIDETENSDN